MSESEQTVQVEIFRFNPQEDKSPRYQSYEIPYHPGRSVLGVLKHIYENCDTSLAFYRSCRIGKCTGCHVKVNGKVRLACTTIANEGKLRIEPMPGYRVVRDLVVDRTKSGLEANKGASSD
jgi:succinate dehydrogenase/fumarate reductase iron-sulfur protein